ncbi:hypothetical protein [Streptomyces sp. t39]|uniref:hypothetical protein n=1 Tax=Streptomyces sp. t39 TaxID=1828156 RepID=UPI00164F5313|nr:hypothetical protein [Streptomyces sp. t39]
MTGSLPPEVDPLLVAAIEDHFDAVDPQSYLDDVWAATDRTKAINAFQDMVTGEIGDLP